jgi:hypothetical protein
MCIIFLSRNKVFFRKFIIIFICLLLLFDKYYRAVLNTSKFILKNRKNNYNLFINVFSRSEEYRHFDMPTSSTYVLTLSTVIQYLSLTIYFITLIIGIIGGICNLITFTAPQLRRNACVFYLLCASAFQLLSILFIIPTSMSSNNFGNKLEDQSIIYCKIRYYFVVTLPQLATYYLLLSTLDRCFASYNNNRIRAWSQLKIAHRLSTAVLIFVFVPNIHLLVFYTIYNNNCQILPGTISTIVISIYTLIIDIFLPYTLMFIFCVITYVNMKEAKRRVIPAPHIQNPHPVINRFASHIIMVSNIFN